LIESIAGFVEESEIVVTIRFRDGNEATLAGDRWLCTDRVLERMLNAVQQSWICYGRTGLQESNAVVTIARLFNGEIVDPSQVESTASSAA
jgi:hypothetical protein